ncbi:hypothetical protein PIB30_033221 [Stylosanthes scabra]|uniref:Transposase (Putative), gypsy type n=1 Tax=Stylosanthes scabra TaxID=79078 RepID=A0ABU6UF33_9FABA|nr:hypothetical protein [Stylosanthes scabra]
MGKKRSCQDVRGPRPLNEVEAQLYGWVDEEVLTQPLVIPGDSLPELRRNIRLMRNVELEGDYVLEAAGPSDRVPFRAGQDGPHFLWVYQELFTRLWVSFPLSDFQRAMLTRCRVAVSPLHLNGWGFLQAFERVCLHFGFHPTARNPFPWVYWNPDVKDFTVFKLDPLETAACKFLLSLPAGLPKKKNDFSCRWILDHSDVEVAQFLDSLLEVKMKQNRLDKLKVQLADTSKMGPRSILPVANPVHIPVVVPSAAASASSSTDAAASLKDEVSVTERVLGEDSAWEHDVHPVKLAFSDKFDYRKAVDGGVASSSVRRALVKMPTEQLLGESYRFTTKALACFQVGLEGTLSSKLKTENELAVAQDQISLLTAERDSALAYLPLKEEVDTLKDQFSEREGERQSALDRVNQLEEDIKVLNTQLASCWLSLEKEQKKVEVAEKDIRALNASLVEKQTALGTANASTEFWEAEWMKLGDETLDMCQETLETVLDQVSHLCLGVDFSAITLDTRWDPKTRRIVNRKKASDEDLEMVDDPRHIDAASQEQQSEKPEQVQQSELGSVAREGVEYST